MILGKSIGHTDISMAECVPLDTTFLSTYQSHAWEQIMWDDNRRTIQGLSPEAYMLKGLEEELEEIYDSDKNEPEYDRIGAIMLLPDSTRSLKPESATATAVKRHLKEFGDSSWYLSNYLKLFSIDLERTLPVGKLAWRLDNASQPRSTEAFGIEVDIMFPWLKLAAYAGELEIAASGMLHEVQGHKVRKPRDERIPNEQKLLIASGKFVLAMLHILKARFNVTYQEVLGQNQQKLDKRIVDGTIFDKSGGDDR